LGQFESPRWQRSPRFLPVVMSLVNSEIIVFTEIPKAEYLKKIARQDVLLTVVRWTQWTDAQITTELKRRKYAIVVLDCPDKETFARIPEVLKQCKSLPSLRDIVYHRNYSLQDPEVISQITQSWPNAAIVSSLPHHLFMFRLMQHLAMGYEQTTMVNLVTIMHYTAIFEHGSVGGPFPIGIVANSAGRRTDMIVKNHLPTSINVRDTTVHGFNVHQGIKIKVPSVLDFSYTLGDDPTPCLLQWDAKEEVYTPQPLVTTEQRDAALMGAAKCVTSGVLDAENVPAKDVASKVISPTVSACTKICGEVPPETNPVSSLNASSEIPPLVACDNATKAQPTERIINPGNKIWMDPTTDSSTPENKTETSPSFCSTFGVTRLTTPVDPKTAIHIRWSDNSYSVMPGGGTVIVSGHPFSCATSSDPEYKMFGYNKSLRAWTSTHHDVIVYIKTN